MTLPQPSDSLTTRAGQSSQAQAAGRSAGQQVDGVGREADPADVEKYEKQV